MRPALFVILFTFLTPAAFGDTVILKNGDHITGSIIKKETGKLIFKTTYAGDIKISWADISSLVTSKPVQVVLKNQTTLEQASFSLADKGKATIAAGQVNSPLVVSLDSVQYINPSAAVSGRGYKVSGRVNVGISIAKGNTENESYNLDTEVIVRSKTNRFTVGASLFKASDNNIDTEDKNTAYFKYDHFLGRKKYVYGNSSFARDMFRDQKLKSTLGIGYGHQFIEAAERNLSLEGGINYVNDDFYVAADDSYTAGRWALKYDEKFFNSRIQFFHGHEGLLDLGNSDNLTIASQTGFRFPILPGMNASLQFNLDWDKSPPAGTSKTDRKLLFSVGYSW